METQSIRERINAYQGEILAGDLLPERAAIILNELSALYGNILDRIKDTEMIYNKVLLKHLEEEQKANRAKIKAEITDEYQDLKDATNTEKVAIQMIRSLSKFLKAKENEYQTAKFQ